MTDIHDLRAQMREARSHPTVARSGGFKIPFGLVAVAAIAVGFVVVMFAPKIYSPQRTATLPVFKDKSARAEEPAAAPAPAPSVVPMSGTAPNYAGKSADDVMRLADAVCEHRAMAAPQKGQAAVEAKLQCFLSEGTARFCTGGQARKATADIINYFKGIEYTNAAVGMASKLPFRNPAADAAAPTPLAPDARVVEAIEGLLRAGYLSKGNREDILANVPRDYKARFAPIVGNKAPCPEPSWWQVWK